MARANLHRKHPVLREICYQPILLSQCRLKWTNILFHLQAWLPFTKAGASARAVPEIAKMEVALSERNVS